MFYGTGQHQLPGPSHGSMSQAECKELELLSKIVSVNFYGNQAPFLDGIMIKLEDGSGINAGSIEVSGQEKRTKYFPAQSGDSSFDYEFFGFLSSNNYQGVSEVDIESISIVSYNPEEFETNKDIINLTDDWISKLEDDIEASILGQKEQTVIGMYT